MPVPLRVVNLIIFACLAALGAACSGSQSGSQASPGPGAAFPSATPDVNLLSYDNGTIVRSYPTGLTNDPTDVAVHGPAFKDGAAGPWEFVYEFAGVAGLGKIAVSIPGADLNPLPSVTVAVSTDSAATGFHDIGAFKAAGGQNDPVVLQLDNVRARWLRLTVDGPAARPFNGITVYGNLEPRPPNAPAYSGIYVQRRQPYDHLDGRFEPAPLPSDLPLYLHVVAPRAGIGGEYCTAQNAADSFPGSFDGRTWIPDHPDSSHLVVNDEGTLIVGGIADVEAVFARTSVTPAFCTTRDGGGTGPKHVLVLDPQQPFDQYPLGDYAYDEPDFHFTELAAGLFDSSDLAGNDAVMLDGVCRPADMLAKGESDALLDWVRAGHKLLVLTAGACAGGADFGFLPYPFTASPPAKQESTGNAVTLAENDEFGTSDPADTARFLDTRLWTIGSNQGAVNSLAVTHDSHWCGHLFASNADGLDGFAQMYARYGRGLIVFDGFDRVENDDASYQRMRRLELRATTGGDLPCTVNPALPFVLAGGVSSQYHPGKARVVDMRLELLPSAGWKGHVALSLSGALSGNVNPSDVALAGEPKTVHAIIDLPAGARASRYAVFVMADGDNGEKAEALAVIDNALPIDVQLKTAHRVSVPAIRFEPGSSSLAPSAQAALAELGKALRENPKWRILVEAHTDSEGGTGDSALTLAQARAITGVLIKRYHVKPNRLIAVGAGSTNPVASNATALGRTLNQRVEFVRL